MTEEKEMKEVRYLLTFKSDRLKKEFMNDFNFKGVKNDKYTRTGDRYREISYEGETQYQCILSNQAMAVNKKKITVSQSLWQNISGNTNVFSRMYEDEFGTYAEKVQVNNGISFWSTETEIDNRSLKSIIENEFMIQRLEKYFHIKKLGQKSLLEIAKEFIE